MPSLFDYSQKSSWRVVGLMSGTSLDGIDAACVEISCDISAPKVLLRGFVTVPFAPDLRERVMRVCDGGSVAELALLNVELGEAFADAALQVIASCDLETDEIDLIGSHGQTVAHWPQRGATLQIGEAAIIAERTGITTVADFRPRDMAAGGQGAPLVPFADYLLLRHATQHRIVQNIGGIANLTWLRAACELSDVRAWDTGPGNMVIDECVRVLTSGQKYFDVDGAMAARGKTDEIWLNTLMQHPFFHRAPPKSCGREEFGRGFAQQFLAQGKSRGLNDCDIIATATALTARSIARDAKVLLAEVEPRDCEMILGGGGAFNSRLRTMLAREIAPVKVLAHEDVGLRSDAKEAIAFALLAHATMMNNPNNVPAATGARRPVVLGKIITGNARPDLL